MSTDNSLVNDMATIAPGSYSEMIRVGGEILVNTATVNASGHPPDHGAGEWRLRGNVVGRQPRRRRGDRGHEWRGGQGANLHRGRCSGRRRDPRQHRYPELSG